MGLVQSVLSWLFGRTPSLTDGSHVVIVGGGYAGFTAARALQKRRAQFTLISDRKEFYHNLGGVRAVVEKDLGKKLMIPLDKIFGGSFRQGRVAGVRPEVKEVVLEDGTTVSYSVLIIATGTQGTFPYAWGGVDAEQALADMESTRLKLEQSSRVLVVGGGPTGVEQAAEVAVKWPEKHVTLLHSRDKLVMDGLTDKFYRRLDQILVSMNISVITGERIELASVDLESAGPYTVTTDKGTNLEFDYLLKCIGLYVDPAAYKDGLESSMLPTGQLKVNDYLEVEGHEDIYAIGDCNSRSPNLAYTGIEQANLLVNNIYKKAAGRKRAAWSDSIPVKIVMSVGPHAGVGQFSWGWMFPEFLARKIKSNDLMIAQTWGTTGLPVPN